MAYLQDLMTAGEQAVLPVVPSLIGGEHQPKYSKGGKMYWVYIATYNGQQIFATAWNEVDKMYFDSGQILATCEERGGRKNVKFTQVPGVAPVNAAQLSAHSSMGQRANAVFDTTPAPVAPVATPPVAVPPVAPVAQPTPPAPTPVAKKGGNADHGYATGMIYNAVIKEVLAQIANGKKLDKINYEGMVAAAVTVYKHTKGWLQLETLEAELPSLGEEPKKETGGEAPASLAKAKREAIQEETHNAKAGGIDIESLPF